MRAFERLAILSVNINRVKHHVLEGTYACAIITATKGAWYFEKETKDMPQKKAGDYVREQDNKRRKELVSDLKASGYGYFPITGHYIEAGSKDSLDDSKEKSFFVIDNQNKPEVFKKKMMALGKKYDQESILFRYPHGLFYLVVTTNYTTESGVKKTIGMETKIPSTWKENIEKKIGIGFSTLKNGKSFQIGASVLSGLDEIFKEEIK